MDEHANTEGSIDNVSLPGDVLERRWSEHGNCKVENPVTSSSKRSTSLSRSRVTPNLRTVQPNGNTPGVSERTDEQVTTSNDTPGSSFVAVWNAQSNTVVTVNSINWLSVSSQNTGDTELEGHHKSSTTQQDKSTTELVQKVQSRNGDDDVQHVLNGRSNQVSVTRVTSHLENVDNVVHHDVHTGQLAPDLGRHSSDSSWKVLLGEQVGITEVLDVFVNQKLFFDLRDFNQNIWVLSVTMSLDFGNNLFGIIPVSLFGQPSWRLGDEEKTEHQKQTWDNLNTPSDSERCNTVDLGTTITDVEHNHDT